MKTKRTQVHFGSDVFAAVALSDRKVPNREFTIEIIQKTTLCVLVPASRLGTCI